MLRFADWQEKIDSYLTDVDENVNETSVPVDGSGEEYLQDDVSVDDNDIVNDLPAFRDPVLDKLGGI